MKLLLEYFGVLIFAFVVLVGGLIVLPTVIPMPESTTGEMVGMALGFVAIAGGFVWFYLAQSHQGHGPPPTEEPRGRPA